MVALFLRTWLVAEQLDHLASWWEKKIYKVSWLILSNGTGDAAPDYISDLTSESSRRLLATVHKTTITETAALCDTTRILGLYSYPISQYL